MDKLELLPCPFCGGKAKLTEVEPSGYVVECTNGICNASTNIRYSCGDDARPLVSAQWNRRASLTRPAEGEGREQFEIYATNQGCRDFEETSEDGYRRYTNPHTEGRWAYWKASRAALIAARAKEGE